MNIPLRFLRPLTASLVLATNLLFVSCQPTAPKLERVQWQCAAFYEPARSIWNRTVTFEYANQPSSSHATDFKLSIDQVPVHGYNLENDILQTHLDSERITLNLTSKTWSSNFRGMSSSQGQCEVLS